MSIETLINLALAGAVMLAVVCNKFADDRRQRKG